MPGGHFPAQQIEAATPESALVPLRGENLNHPSFQEQFPDDTEAAGLTLVRQAVAQGFGEVFTDRQSAEQALGGTVYPAPLGTVSKPRGDGSWNTG